MAGTTRIGRTTTAVCALFLLACAAGHAWSQGTAAPLPRLLILNSADATLPAVAAQVRTIVDAVSAANPSGVEIYTEAMDAMRRPEVDVLPELVAVYARKFERHPPDVVVTIGDEAFELFLAERGRLWPAAKAISISMSEAAAKRAESMPDVVTVPLRFDPLATLALARRLQPGARHLTVISGSTPFDRAYLDGVRPRIERDAGTWQVTWADDRAMQALLAEVAALPPDSAILYLTMFQDAAGQPFAPRDAVERIAAAASAPVYGMYESFLDRGIVGGAITSMEEQSRVVAAIATRLLAGERVDAVRFAGDIGPRPVVVWPAFVRHGLEGARLGPEVRILGREPSFWERYRWYALGFATVLLLETALIAALLFERRMRHRVEAERERQRAEVAHGSRLAIVGELTASIAHEINQPLGAILGNADAADLMLERGPPRTEYMRQILADIRRDGLRASDVIRHVRALARKHDPELSDLDGNAMVRDVLALIAPDVRRRGVVVAVALAPDLPPVRGDRVHLEQVLLNLAINAMDAMADMPAARRVLSVRTSVTVHGDIEFLVADRGPGIPPDRLPRLFDSFFTTKTHGMGLGLSIARSIVEAHGGRIVAENASNGGALFRFTVPSGARAKEAAGAGEETAA